MITIAFVWAYLGYIDIVVRANGIIRPYDEISTVITPVSGEIILLNFYEGMWVNQGDILLEIDTTQLANERILLVERLKTLEFQLDTLQLYYQSLKTGENLIGSFNPEYSARLDGFFLNLNSMEHFNNAHSNMLSSEMQNLQSLHLQISFELEMTRLLLYSINSKSNAFDESLDTLTSRESEVFFAYRNRYLNFVINMYNQDFLIQNLEESLAGNILVRDSIETNQNLFVNKSIYQSLYEEFIMRHTQLVETYALERNHYARIETLYAAGAISQVEIIQAVDSVEQARFNLDDFLSRFMINLNNEIRELENRLVLARSQRELLRVETVTETTNQILQLENSLQDLSQGISNNQLTQLAVFNVGSELGDITLNRLLEVNNTLHSIAATEQEISSIHININSIDVQLEQSILRSPIDGYINASLDLTIGSFLMSGIPIMDIVPTIGEALTANIFINNSDIGRIEEGMVVRYLIPAIPRRNFGDVTGNVERIAPDVVSNQLGYFLLEASLEDTIFYDNSGNSVSLRIGMAFDARIVVDRQRVLFYLLDEVNLWIR